MSSNDMVTIEEWQQMQRPPLWPYLQVSRFHLPPAPDPDSLLGMVFPSEDDEDPDDEEDDVGDTEEETGENAEGYHEEHDETIDDANDEGLSGSEMDTNSDDNESVDYETEDEEEVARIHKIHYDLEVKKKKNQDDSASALRVARGVLIDSAKAEAAARYDPEQIVSLVVEFYDLMVEMGHWPAEAVSKAPHSRAVNVELGKLLGYDPRMLELMERIPYINGEWNQKEHYIVPHTALADYRDQKHMIAGRCPSCCDDDNHPAQDPWILPLTLPNRSGLGIYLNTKFGTIISYKSSGYPEAETIGKEGQEAFLWTYKHRKDVFITAEEFFRGCIEAYKSLQVLPIIAAEHNDPKEWDGAQGKKQLKQSLDYQEIREQQRALLRYYREFGWFENWRRSDFLEKWNQAREFIREKYELEREEAETEGSV